MPSCSPAVHTTCLHAQSPQSILAQTLKKGEGKGGKEGGEEERLPSPSFLHEGNFLMSSRIIKVKMDTRWVSNRGNSRCVSLEVISQKLSVSDLFAGGKKNKTIFLSI